jgi:Xaa-Pro dipeptidase
VTTSSITGGSGALLQPLAFEPQEYASRLARVRDGMAERGIDVFLCWTPENILYLTGHDSIGYYFYQCSVVTLEHDPVNVVRRAMAECTWNRSAYRLAAPYLDHEDPIELTWRVIEEIAPGASAIGVEENAWFTSPKRYAQLRERAPGGTGITDASMLVESLRAVKSERELEYIRRGCRAADAAMAAGIAATRAGARDTDVAIAVWSAMLGQGSQEAGVPPILATGYRTNLPQATWCGREIVDGDRAWYEIPGVFERYVGCLGRSGSVGPPSADFARRAEAAREATSTAIDAIRPGIEACDVHRLCHETYRRAGYGDEHLARSGYSIGLNYAPDWGEGQIVSFMESDHTPLVANMTFHLMPSLRAEYNTCLSEAIRVTDDGCEVLTTTPRDLFVQGGRG